MSADVTSVCPACYARAADVPFEQVTLDQLNGVVRGESAIVISNELREYHDIYIDAGHMVFEIDATCRVCNYGFQFVHRQPLPQPQETP